MNINQHGSAAPLYKQLIDGFRKKICNGSMSPGGKVPPVREIAGELGINPNTVQKALSELEAMGLVRTERTSGRYVTSDEGIIIQSRIGMMQELCGSFLYDMIDLGCTKDEIIHIIEVNAPLFGQKK